MTDEELARMARATATYLCREDAVYVATQALKHTKQFSVLMSAHGGERYSSEELARLCLRIAKRCGQEGGES